MPRKPTKKRAAVAATATATVAVATVPPPVQRSLMSTKNIRDTIIRMDAAYYHEIGVSGHQYEEWQEDNDYRRQLIGEYSMDSEPTPKNLGVVLF